MARRRHFRPAAGGRAARIVRRTAYRDANPGPSVRMVSGPFGLVERHRTSYHIWAITQGLRHKSFQLRSRYMGEEGEKAL